MPDIWSEAEITDIRVFIGAGMSLRSIAQRFGKPLSAIYRCVKDRHMAVQTNEWTDEQTSTAKLMWERGDRMSAIVAAVGRTSEAIRGKMERMGAHRPRVERKKAMTFRFDRQGPESAKKAPWMPPAQEEPTGEKVINGCRYIAGEPLPDESCYCNLPKQSRSSYCPHHHARCWMLADDRIERLEALA